MALGDLVDYVSVGEVFGIFPDQAFGIWTSSAHSERNLFGVTSSPDVMQLCKRTYLREELQLMVRHLEKSFFESIYYLRGVIGALKLSEKV